MSKDDSLSNAFERGKPGTPARDSAEAAIEQVRQRGGVFVDAVRATRMAMALTDPSLPGNPIVFANQSFLDLSDYSMDEVLGQQPFFMNGADTDPEDAERFCRILDSDQDGVVETVQYAKGGRRFVATVLLSAFKDESGRTLYHFLSWMRSAAVRRPRSSAYWGARLLEANVRSFLQARGKVNRGIRDTIREEPSMFFSYNNGLTTTADSVEVATHGEGLFLMSASNFQIVNGGQTTASIHALRKLAADQLKDVYVQMKLTVVPSEKAEIVVPNISQFANSQNKVNAADFFANHPFHIRMEEFSRRILAPIGDSNYREHKWFYERARGQRS